MLGHEQRLGSTSVSMISTVRIQAEVLLWVFLTDAVSRVIADGSSRALELLLPAAVQDLPVRYGRSRVRINT